MKNLKTLLLGATVLFFASCIVTRPYAVTNNEIGDAVGTSKTTVIFGTSSGTSLQAGVFSTNKEFGVIQAAKNGEIDKIATVDVQTANYGLFSIVRIIVTGTEASN
jgi:hypothetical protein